MIRDIVQRTDEWFAWRRLGLTASQIADILGYGYKTPWRVWAEYLGKVEPEDLSGNPAVQRGIELEDIVRQHFEERHAEVAIPVCVEWDDDPIFRASLDGITSDGVPTEYKVIGGQSFQDILRYGSSSMVVIRYWAQVQHQMLCTGADHAWLAIYGWDADEGNNYAEFRIERDDAFLENELIPEGRDFWKRHIQKKTPPKLDPLRDVYIPEGDQLAVWREKTRQWQSVKERIDGLQAQMDDLSKQKKEIEKIFRELMGDFRNAYAYGINLTRYQMPGRINYKKIVEDRLPGLTPTELEAYRGKQSSESIRVIEKKPDSSIIELEARSREQAEARKNEELKEEFPLAAW